ncbi:MAG: single-stranded-DNA-specific exonuclease RecJ [Bacteroidales bacterium]|nr:single-stranded-DNA-specific exonuclease RecJ [Bacteroidales bacterium]
MKKRWVILDKQENQKTDELSKQLNNLHPILVRLLVQRQIDTKEKVKAFFKPTLKNLHDPFLMKDMDKAVSRLDKAIKNQEKILVYGDYDVDGTSSVALMYSFVKTYDSNIEYYIPDRYKEGYGISIESIEYAKEQGFTLIIALDCGIKAHNQVAKANEYGIDIIVCDHHRPGDTLPAAYAVLDPKREDCDYPFRELSGCGVGFKLIQAYTQFLNRPIHDIVKYLDLVAISIASDVVPIVDENRILAYFGLRVINNQPRPGIEATILQNITLKKTDTKEIPFTSIFNKEITISDLVFTVGPRINAAGRMDTGRNSVKLLITESLDATLNIGNKIKQYNEERKTKDRETFEEALQMIKKDDSFGNKRSLVIYKPDWHKGVIGIVASRLVEQFYKPSIVFTESNGLITGSARSVKDFDIYDAIEECESFLEHFGGHKYAAGLSLLPENLSAFMEKFEEVVQRTITEASLHPEIEIDSEILICDITPDFYQQLNLFAPFGPDNMSPIFMTTMVYDDGNARQLGSNGNKHLKLNIVHPTVSSYPIPAIAFGLGDFYENVKDSKHFNICYHIEENIWNNNTTLQLNIKDMQVYVKKKD